MTIMMMAAATVAWMSEDGCRSRSSGSGGELEGSVAREDSEDQA